LGQPSGGEHRRLQLADVHPSNGVRLTALIAARVNHELDLPVARFPPFLAHLEQDAVVGGVLWRRGRQLDAQLRLCSR
jgi:hypothetical protein